ncbi:hypothetical protein PVBG_00336 [Plasmodium vivax Brazil I]|uniref:Rhodanese domain-containing protein n=1 Tax=Plasmodium vivax (strain Brazil I) TaxID=1033975 RepID=A0A0J9SP37_PLAV1|nr:hypothetical protein PVBG_00336 [Plasmodium vivax Brazil I]
MSPEIYAASWFLTLFASKSNLEISNAIYLIFLLERNPFFYFFFSLALLILHRNIFLCVDSSNLPELLSKINIFNKKFLKKVWSLGKFLEANTPVSFVHKLFFIKNVLMYLTDEHPADSQQKKDILLEFFNSIDYMSVNAFEIIKNISLGKHKYIFLDIRSRRHFRTFHLKSSINVELVEGYADILRGQIDSQDRRRKRKKERKKQWKAERKNARKTQLQTEPRKQWKAEPGGVPPPIAHILKRFGSREVARNAGLLFSHLLREKYSQRSRLSYDDNVMLTRVVSAGARRGSPLDFSALGRSSGRRRRRRAKQLGREKQMEKANHMGRANQMGRAKGRQEEAFPNLHLLRGERNAEVDLNAFICSAYARRRPPRGEARRGKMKGKPYEHVNMKYVEERKAKSRKRYHSDDDVVARPFGLACHRMKGAFLARLEGEQVSGQVSGKVGVKVNSQPNRQNHSKCLPSEPPPCAAAPAQSQNTSSFNLYVLIKEKVLCDEDCLRFLFEDVLTPEKQVIILYDDKWDNAKYVRGFYYELLFNTKLRQVAIIEGGINSYHSLMRLDLFERKVSSLVPSFISTAGGTNKERSPHGDEAPQLYTPQCLLGRNKKTMKKFFHPNHSCYLCDYRHFRKTKKKLLDDCFFESYSNFTIFELFFCFLGGEREDVSFASFYEQIAWVKSRQGGGSGAGGGGGVSSGGGAGPDRGCSAHLGGAHNRKKDSAEGSSFTLSGLLNYIKRKKGSVSDPSVFANRESFSPHGGGGGTSPRDLHNEAHVSSFVSQKKISESTNGDMHICNNAKVKKHYFGLNHYVEFCSRKRSDLLSVAASVQARGGEAAPGGPPPVSEMSGEVSGDICGDICDEEGELLQGEDEVSGAPLPSDRSEATLNVCRENQWRSDEAEAASPAPPAPPAATAPTVATASLASRTPPAGRADSFADVASEPPHEPPRRGHSIGSDHVPEGIKRSCSSSSDVYSLYSYIDVVCYRSLLLKGGATQGSPPPQRKLYSCFITYIYQPLIPHNIRSNNIISNLVHYVKYFKCIKRGNGAINDPNLYLQCNKLDYDLAFQRDNSLPSQRDNSLPSQRDNSLPFQRDSSSPFKWDPKLPFKLSYFPFRSMPLLPGARAGAANEVSGISSGSGSGNGNSANTDSNAANNAANTANTANTANPYDERVNDERVNDCILSNTCLKNRPELGLCKLMIYDHLLVLYGTPYLCEVSLPVQRCGGAAVEKFAAAADQRSGEDPHLGDIGTKNFLREREEYSTGGTNDEEWYLSSEPGEELQKVLIHKHKNLKKKDILFTIDSYKIKGTEINWAKVSPHVLRSITRDHITDTYSYYKSYFSVSTSHLLATSEERCFSVSSSVSSDSSSYSSCVSDEPNFSFSDYHSLYAKNAKRGGGKDGNRRVKSAMGSGGRSAMGSGGRSAMGSGGRSAMGSGGRSAMRSGGRSAMRSGGRSSSPPKGGEASGGSPQRKAKVDVVNVYAVFDIHTLCKITTKRGSARTLYFYFATNRSTPLMVLNFDSDLEVQSCVRSIREVYSRYANGEAAARGE